MKKAYAATFSNGTTITRKSERAYSHAWAAFDANDALVTRFCATHGFASSAALAEKAAAACAARLPNHVASVEVVPAIAA